MESPLKKRKIASQESQASKITSTPQRNTDNYQEVSPAISRIRETSSSSSSCSYKDDVPVSRKILNFSKDKQDGNYGKAVVSDRSSLIGVLENDSLADETDMEDDEDILDYDEFFSKLARFQKKGSAWNLFKPFGQDEGSLYHLILNTPREAGDKAKWFVSYCKNASNQGSIYLIYKFCLDCSGYQKTDIKKYFTDRLPPVPDLVNAIMSKVDDEQCNAEVFTTGKFLFAADKSRLAKILQKGIFNFLQKYVLEAHNQDLLYGEQFVRLLKFLVEMAKASYIPLIYTGVIFMIKLLTAVCMVKVNISETALGGKQVMMLDNYINTLYLNSVKACLLADSSCSSLKLACITELTMWIHYSGKVFIDHYNCVSMLGKLAMDGAKTVRLAALETFLKMVQNEQLVSYLQAGPIENLVDHVAGRFCDIDVTVAQKAVEVYTAFITHYLKTIQKRKKIFEVLVQNIYHKDYRMGSAACKCVIQILITEDIDKKTLLLQICKLSMNFHPTLKPLLVESCMENTDVLQNWSLIFEILASPHCRDVSVEIKATLSELFLESVHQVLTGLTSKVRQFSRRALSCDWTRHKLIADEVYPRLKAILVLFRTNPHVARNILNIATKVKPEYLSNEHIEPTEQFLQSLMKFFVFWTDTDTVTALLDFLLFVNEHVPKLGPASRNTIEDLKKYVSEALYKSFKSRDHHTIVTAKKTAMVFSKFDLNENIEWSKLLLSWDIIESNSEYLENMMKCCYWSLIWKIRKLSSAHLSKTEQNKEVSYLTNMSTAFFSNCLELLGHEDISIKFKAYERICESYMGFCQELENISKQIRTLEDLKPCLNEAVQKQLTDVFELTVGTCEDLVARKYAMYIVNMALLKILPMSCISIIFKYYNKYYDTYGKQIESVLSTLLEKDDNWVSILLINAICICFERFLVKHGVVDIRSQEAKDILALSRKFVECKLLKNPKIASKLMFYAVNYAVETGSYEFLIFVRVFINQIQDHPEMRKEILEHLKRKVPKPDSKLDPVLYFVKHLANGEFKKPDAHKLKTPGKKGRPHKVPSTPKLNITFTKVKKAPKGREKVMPTKQSQTTESEASSEDMTIHDTSSDDVSDLNLSNLAISK